MSNTLHQFGRVLFAELEQIAVRRSGGFASLEWVRKNLEDAQDSAQKLRHEAARPNFEPSLRKKADECAQQARNALRLVAQATNAVDQLLQVITELLGPAQEVLKKIKPPDQPLARPVALKPLAALLRALKEHLAAAIYALKGRIVRPRHSPADWHRRVRRVERRLAGQARVLEDARQMLNVQAIRDKNDKVIEETERVARMLQRSDRSLEEQAPEALRKAAGERFNEWDIQEQLIRRALVLWSDDLARALKTAGEEFGHVIKAYQLIAKAKQGADGELGSLVAEQLAPSRYEIYHFIEDNARKSAIRMRTVGLALSGGGIRSATFNLGFLQGAAALGLLKQFDYLSTVSGGGYIGAWFAAWVRREGGHELEPPAELDFIRELAARSAAAEKKINDKIRKSPHAVGDQQAPEAALEGKREEAKPLLQKGCDLQLLSSVKDISDIPKRGEGLIIVADVGDVLHFRMFDGDGKVVVDTDEKGLTEQAEQIENLRKQLERLRPPHELTAGEKVQLIAVVTSIVGGTLQKRYEDAVAVQRQRTAGALENVQMQLNSSRARQAEADRRWVSPKENRDGREATDPAPPLKLTVEEEPEPVYHLRAHSNYLAPKLGLLSIDTWTMVSIYLRNLFLNQFILLPMMLAAIALPRLVLLLFAHSTSCPVMTLARRWLDGHRGWPVRAVLLATFVATATVPKLIDSFGRRAVGTVRPKFALRAILAVLALGLTALMILVTPYAVCTLVPANSQGMVADTVWWLARHSWEAMGAVFVLLLLVGAIARRRVDNLALSIAQRTSERARAWGILFMLVFLIALLASCALPVVRFVEPARWLTGDLILFLVTFFAGCLGFHQTYKTVAQIRESRGLAPVAPADYRLTKRILWWRIVGPLGLVSLGVSLLFARPGKPFFVCPVPYVRNLFNPVTANWLGMEFWPAVCFGGLVGFMRGTFVWINLKDKPRPWTFIERVARAWSAFTSGLISGAGLAAVLSWLRGPAAVQPDVFGPVMMSFGPALVMVAMGAGSAIEVGLIGGYGEEDMREWRASLGAYLLIIGTLWAVLCVLSIYGPLFLWWLGSWAAWAAGAVWVIASFFGALAGRSERTCGVKTSKRPLEYVAVIAPPLFLIGLVVAVSVLVAALQGVDIPIQGTDQFLHQLAHAGQERTWAVLLASAYMAMVGCVHANINLFGLNAFYANRLIRCYLGASRPREAPAEVRPRFAPTNSPGPLRRPNLITGFDRNDDFPLHKLAIVRRWGCDVRLMSSVKDVKDIPTVGKDLIVVFVVDEVLHFRAFDSDGNKVVDTDENRLAAKAVQIEQIKEQLEGLWPPHELTASEKVRLIAAVASIVDRVFDDLVVDYRGPYHLINTAMNLVAGDELAWQERMAESFILSPLYCGSKTTGYRRATRIVKSDLDSDELEPKEWRLEPSSAMSGYGDDIRLGTAISISGAAASPNAGYHSSPLVTFLMTVLNARLGLWFGNPARMAWRQSGPGFASPLFAELFGLTTSKGKYVYLSDGGHFENLGAYELVRRRCRYIVVCDAGADDKLSFGDLGSLVRKCRQDFGIRIEIDTSPLQKKEGSSYAKWHCAVGKIHYADVDVEADPGTLIYIKPSLTGDEPSDVRNYQVGHQAFPHEPTSNQFFSESQFESYRALGEHIGVNVFGDVVRDAGRDAGPDTLFFRLRRRWEQVPSNLDGNLSSP
jgi:Patatin-like phospholipase